VSYYEGDFYRGDPGFGSFLSKAVSYGRGLLGVGVGGPALGAVGKIAGGIMKLPGGAKIISAGRVLSKHPVLTAAGAAGAIGAAGAMIGGRGGGGGPRGFHMGKKGHLVRNRRMRVTNPKALRRAIRRATGFARLARRVLRFTSPKAPKGRAIFKHRRAKR